MPDPCPTCSAGWSGLRCDACGRPTLQPCPWCAKVHEGGPDRCLSGVVLVCGGRDFDDCAFVFRALDRLNDRMLITAIRHGAARGADDLAGQWAKRRCVAEQRFPVDWKAHGKDAGRLRNQQMLDAEPTPVAVVGFPGGFGTADMIRRAQGAGLNVWLPKYDGDKP